MEKLYKRLVNEVEAGEIAYENLVASIASTKIKFRELGVNDDLIDETLGIMTRAQKDLELALRAKVSIINEIADIGKEEKLID